VVSNGATTDLTRLRPVEAGQGRGAVHQLRPLHHGSRAADLSPPFPTGRRSVPTWEIKPAMSDDSTQVEAGRAFRRGARRRPGAAPRLGLRARAPGRRGAPGAGPGAARGPTAALAGAHRGRVGSGGPVDRDRRRGRHRREQHLAGHVGEHRRGLRTAGRRRRAARPGRAGGRPARPAGRRAEGAAPRLPLELADLPGRGAPPARPGQRRRGQPVRAPEPRGASRTAPAGRAGAAHRPARRRGGGGRAARAGGRAAWAPPPGAERGGGADDAGSLSPPGRAGPRRWRPGRSPWARRDRPPRRAS
jgi:hypothetical protein